MNKVDVDSAAVLEAIVKASNDAIFSVDLEGHAQSWNTVAEDLYGYVANEIINQPIFKIVPEDLQAELKDCFSRVIQGEKIEQYEIICQTKDDSFIEIALTLSPVSDPQDNVQAVVCIAKDISYRREKEQTQQLTEELQQSNKELEHFAYVTSHDLRAPLRAITTLAQWIMEDNKDKLDEESLENMNEIVNRTKRLNKLVEGILEYSRIGKMNIDIEEIESLAIIDDVVQAIHIPENTEVNVVEPESFPRINYNDIHFYQVVQNLASNAVKHSNVDKGEVKLSYKDLGGEHEFCVKDNGKGIDPKHHDRIFLLFQTLAAKDTTDSVGIGLTIVKKIVENYRGRIRLESEEGQGASFYFTVPKDIALVQHSD